MDNKEFLALQEQLRQASEDPAFKKFREHRLIVETHLTAPAQTLVEEYFLAKRSWLSRCLVTNHMFGDKDISDVIRGKILAIDDMLETKNVFKRYDEIEAKVQFAKKGAN